MTEQDYYTYNVGDSERWWVKTPPARNPLFEKELELLGGINPFGQPVIRVMWAGTLKSDVAAKDTLKYKKLWRGLTHFSYTDDNGITHTVKRESDAPPGKFVIPVYSEIELGKLRFVIEKWQSIEDAISQGRFSDQKDSDGLRLFRDPPREGVYNAFFFVETKDGHFRDLDNEVLNAVKGMWRYNENTPLDKKIADLMADAKQEEKEAKEQALSVWKN